MNGDPHQGQDSLLASSSSGGTETLPRARGILERDSDFPYLHGFSKDEQERLKRQASFAEQTIYRDIDFSQVDQLLEVGCGVGAQTQILLRRFPFLNLTGIDRSDVQLNVAREALGSVQFFSGRYQLLQMDAQQMDLESNTFDAAFLCWVLEHIPQPKRVLSEVRRVLKVGGQVVVTEVLNSSFFLEPYSPSVWKYWMAFNDYQYDTGGDPFVGAKLGNLLTEVGFRDIQTSVKTWHLDNRQPAKRREIINFWSDLLLSASEQLISDGRVTVDLVEEMKRELARVAKDPNAVFFYSFVQAQARAL